MKKKKLKKKIKRLQKKVDWYRNRLVGEILSNNMKEMTRK
jgi:hypothetical protein